MTPEEQQAENRRRLGELVMRFMDDLDEEFEGAVLMDFAIVAEVGHGGPAANMPDDADVSMARWSIRYRCSSWRPLIAAALFHGADQVIRPQEHDDDD